MSAGIEAATAAACRALPAVAGLPPASRVLDIGGGTGSWAIALAASRPDLTATVFELPEVAAVAEERLRTAGFSARISVLAGDLLTDDLPRGHNAFLLANVVHYFTPDTNQSILRKHPGGRRARRTPAPRGLLDRPHAHPATAGRAHGRGVRDPRQRRRRLQRPGGRRLARRHRLELHRNSALAGPISLVTAEAI